MFPSGPATRSALYGIGLLSALKALSLVLMAQAVAGALAGLAGSPSDWASGLVWGAVGAVLRSLAVWGQGVASRRAALGVKEELRAQLLKRSLAEGGTTAVEGTNDGGLAILATRGLDALDDYYIQYLPALVNCATVPLLIGARILFADWVSAVVIVLTVPLVPLFMILIGRHTEDSVRDAQTTLRRLSGHILELAKGLPVLVGLGRASEQRAALEDISEQYRSRTMVTLRTAFLSALALELIATISVAVVAVFIGVRLVAGDMALEAGLLALILAPDCYLPLRELGTAHHASDDGRAALETANTVLKAPTHHRLIDTDTELLAENQASRAGLADIVVAGLTVTYTGRSAPAVERLDFTAPAGSVTALDGDSGAGKSTILGVLAGLIGPGPGASVTGTVTGVSTDTVAWVPQHPVMVADTVQEEMELYLGGEGTADTVVNILRRVSADHLAAKHPAELSPGELRRVALARGLARLESGATVLLLDEPTAHLDHYSASVVRSAITSLRGSATVILIAHDSGTRALADHVVRVEHLPAAKRPAAVAEPGAASTAAVVSTPAYQSASAVKAGANAPNPEAQNAALHTSLNQGWLPNVQRLALVLRPVQAKFAAAGVVGVLAALFAVALSGLSGWLIIRASEQPPILYLLGAIVGVRFFGIGRAVLRYCERLLTHDAIFAAMTRLRGALWAALSRRALSLRRLLQGGNVLGSIVDDVDTLRDLLPRVALPPLTALGVGAAAITATAMVLPVAVTAVASSTLVGLIVAPLFAVLADRNAAKAEQQLRSVVLRGVAAALDARAELTANGVAGRILTALSDKDRAATVSAQRSAWAEGLGQAVTVLACSLAALWAALLGAESVQDGSAAPALVAVIVLMQLALVEPFSATVSAVRQGPALADILGRVAATGALSASADADNADHDASTHPLPDREGKAGLELNGIAAAWPGGPTVFSRVTAEAVPGRWLAVTGPSGAGKSTLLSVLLGFLPVKEGRALLTGTAAWCPQEAHLFDSTIRGNLLLARPAGKKPNEQEMHEALRDVGLDVLVETLPEGLDTRIGSAGAFLSGGERQRLAMARTLLTGARVLLLDEPTAHLDAAAAREMMATLRRGLRNVTVVLVTHNPEDIDPADAKLELPSAAGLVRVPTPQ
ncbi:ABC transporter [Arthrobacter sp. StoSoilA2]|nr:ABC transporter [Arthrobacter sp. StoSoilA2]